MDLEVAYKDFSETYGIANYLENIEYIGINFSNDKNLPTFKVYTRCTENCPQFLMPLLKKDMIHVINKINDTANLDYSRYEVSLKNRTNSNMKFVNSWMLSIFPELEKNFCDIEKFYDIKCCDAPDYGFASMYFLSVILKHSEENCIDVKALKLYFLLRKCSDPDKIGKNYTIDNDYFLKTLYRVEIPEINILTKFINEVLLNTSAELWMTAVEFYDGGLKKYKIYIKKFSKSVYKQLINMFKIIGCHNLVDYIKAYEKWIDTHMELEQYGIAICLDSNGIWSVNFYH